MKTASFRLPADLVRSIEVVSKKRGVSRSLVVRDAISAYLARADKAPMTTSEYVEQLVTWPGSGKGDLASDAERLLRERFRAKRRSR